MTKLSRALLVVGALAAAAFTSSAMAGEFQVTSKDQLTTFAIGEPNTAYAQYFIGNSYLNPYKTDNVSVSNVTFEPACRNNWHTHHKAPQILVVVAGEVKHWHGATQDSWMQHLSVTPIIEGSSNEWLEPVDDKAFAEANQKAK